MPLASLPPSVRPCWSCTYVPGYPIARGAPGNPQPASAAQIRAARAADAVVYVGGSFHGYDYSEWRDNADGAGGTDKPEPGQFEVLVGSASAASRQRASFTL